MRKKAEASSFHQFLI